MLRYILCFCNVCIFMLMEHRCLLILIKFLLDAVGSCNILSVSIREYDDRYSRFDWENAHWGYSGWNCLSSAWFKHTKTWNSYCNFVSLHGFGVDFKCLVVCKMDTKSWFMSFENDFSCLKWPCISCSKGLTITCFFTRTVQGRHFETPGKSALHKKFVCCSENSCLGDKTRSASAKDRNENEVVLRCYYYNPFLNRSCWVHLVQCNCTCPDHGLLRPA